MPSSIHLERYTGLGAPRLSVGTNVTAIGHGAFARLTAPPDLSRCTDLATIADGALCDPTTPPDLTHSTA